MERHDCLRPKETWYLKKHMFGFLSSKTVSSGSLSVKAAVVHRLPNVFICDQRSLLMFVD